MQLLGFLLPPLIDLLNRKITDSDARFWVSIVVCALIGVGLDIMQVNGLGNYTGMTLLEIFERMATSTMTVFGIAQLSYHGFYKNSQLRTDIQQL